MTLNQSLLGHLRHLLDSQIALDLGLIYAINRDPGEVAANDHCPDRVSRCHIRVKAERNKNVSMTMAMTSPGWTYLNNSIRSVL